MFSIAEKQLIAKKIEELLLSLNHPEMLKNKPYFKLHVDGANDWSWADIEPNWVFEDGKESKSSEWNEIVRNWDV